MIPNAASSGLVELYRANRAALLRFLVARTGDVAEAEDILQDVWIRLQSPGIGPVSNGASYLYRIAQNLVLDRRRNARHQAERDGAWSDLRHDGRVAEGDVIDPQPSPEAELLANERVAQLHCAIAGLPDGARRVLQLHKVEGLSQGDVAARLGISKSGVEKHMAVAMKYLRRALID